MGYSLGTPVSSINKTEILLKVALNNITLLSNENVEKNRSILQQEPALCFKTFLISRVKINNKKKKLFNSNFHLIYYLHHDDYIILKMSRRDKVKTDVC